MWYTYKPLRLTWNDKSTICWTGLWTPRQKNWYHLPGNRKNMDRQTWFITNSTGKKEINVSAWNSKVQTFQRITFIFNTARSKSGLWKYEGSVISTLDRATKVVTLIRLADPVGVNPDPDPTLERKNLSDPQEDWLRIRPSKHNQDPNPIYENSSVFNSI